jgi:hypothetical protein
MTVARGDSRADPARWTFPGRFAPRDFAGELPIGEPATPTPALSSPPLRAVRSLSCAPSCNCKAAVAAPLGERRGLKPHVTIVMADSPPRSPLPSGSGVD